MKKCTRCKANIDWIRSFCPMCGAALVVVPEIKEVEAEPVSSEFRLPVQPIPPTQPTPEEHAAPAPLPPIPEPLRIEPEPIPEEPEEIAAEAMQPEEPEEMPSETIQLEEPQKFEEIQQPEILPTPIVEEPTAALSPAMDEAQEADAAATDPKHYVPTPRHAPQAAQSAPQSAQSYEPTRRTAPQTPAQVPSAIFSGRTELTPVSPPAQQSTETPKTEQPNRADVAPGVLSMPFVPEALGGIVKGSAGRVELTPRPQTPEPAAEQGDSPSPAADAASPAAAFEQIAAAISMFERKNEPAIVRQPEPEKPTPIPQEDKEEPVAAQPTATMPEPLIIPQPTEAVPEALIIRQPVAALAPEPTIVRQPIMPDVAPPAPAIQPPAPEEEDKKRDDDKPEGGAKASSDELPMGEFLRMFPDARPD